VKTAVISDLHSNLEALEMVLDDIRRQEVERIVCLGDVVGYGPNPRECVDLAMRFDVCVLGNHDQGALFDPEGFSRGAERAIFWTRDQLEQTNGDPDIVSARCQFLSELPRQHRDGDQLFVHGSPRSPLTEYVFPEDVYNTRKLEKIFGLIERHCFQGHTHVPGVFTSQGRFLTPSEIGGRYVLGEDKAMVNVGSVGQPRDGDPRSCYVVIDDDSVIFQRLEYPIEKTADKIHAIPELDNFLGDRLKEGR
jgi:diadenosine tetraphosphatase ApaH/serine/threonine PP2A family protein phosphatase